MWRTGNVYECRLKGPEGNIPFSCTILVVTALQMGISFFLSTARHCRLFMPDVYKQPFGLIFNGTISNIIRSSILEDGNFTLFRNVGHQSETNVVSELPFWLL
jgi:hypothetical protein